MSSKIYVAFRMYPNSSISIPGTLDEEGLKLWKEYNRVMRFGCAQFVDGICVYDGNCNDDDISDMECAVAEGEYPHITNCTEMMRA